ncbi:hypothetical protein OCAR_5106 [Afipia carboxidovorans OM5]|nr:hypothetical protein OCAR_5106 [Afipia carboxidovorans OM5]
MLLLQSGQFEREFVIVLFGHDTRRRLLASRVNAMTRLS